MAIAFVAASNKNEDTTYTVSVVKPVGLDVGHIMVGLFLGQTDAGASPTLTPPSGFEQIGSTYKIETGRSWGAYWKRADAADVAAASFAFTIPNAGVCYVSAMLLAYSGCASSGTPYDQYSSTDYVTSDLYMRGGTITPTAATSMAVWLGASRNYLNSATAVAGWTERVDARSTHQLYAMEMALSTTDATGNIDVTFGGSAEVRKHAFLLNLVETAASVTYVGRSIGAGVGSGIGSGIS